MNLINDRGVGSNILVAMVLVIVATIATISLIAVVNEDVYMKTILVDHLQEDLLMRADNDRQAIMLGEGKEILPARVVKIVGKDRTVTYRIKVKKREININVFMGMARKQVVSLQSMCTAYYSKGITPSKQSPVKKFMEKLSDRESLAKYQYFTDTEKSDISDNNALSDPAARVKFWGKDALYGKVHSNSDIWIQNAGTPPAGAPNFESWPWFKDMVTTAGHIRLDPSGNLASASSPMEQIFTGGWAEEQLPIVYEPEAKRIKRNGQSPFGQVYDETKIYIMKIDGTSISVKILEILPTHIDTFTVYSAYPDVLHPVVPNNPNTYIGDSLWTNYVAIADTNWLAGSSNLTVSNTSFYMNGTCWIKGNLGGRLTIGTAGHAYVIGDITYANTEPGDFPDDPDNPNRYDMFGLVSEKSIIVKYKHYEKEEGNYILHNDNSEGANGHVWMYGAYAAIGPEDPALEENAFRTAGVFTYEYQHPHGAVTPFYGFNNKTGRDTLYSYIDLHRYKYVPVPPNQTGVAAWMKWPNLTPTANTPGFPQGALPAFPYYPTVDYPWYNPVWPEAVNTIVYERGTLHVYGAIAQRRRGFVHRSGTVNETNPDMGNWDMANYKFGPGHNSTGYNKDYRFDERFYVIQPPDYPEVYRGSGGGMSAFEDTAWGYKIPPKTF